jgi:hypothetical protein
VFDLQTIVCINRLATISDMVPEGRRFPVRDAVALVTDPRRQEECQSLVEYDIVMSLAGGLTRGDRR